MNLFEDLYVKCSRCNATLPNLKSFIPQEDPALCNVCSLIVGPSRVLVEDKSCSSCSYWYPNGSSLGACKKLQGVQADRIESFFHDSSTLVISRPDYEVKEMKTFPNICDGEYLITEGDFLCKHYNPSLT